MKKKMLMLVGALLMALPQVMKAQEMGWQVRAGVGSAGILGGVTDIEDRLGVQVGVNADIPVTQNQVIRFQPGLELARKGWKFRGGCGNEQILDARFSTRLDYLQMPLVMAARLRLGEGTSISFRAGTYVAYGLSAKTHMDVTDTDYSETFPQTHFSEPCDFQEVAQDGKGNQLKYPKFHRWDAGLTGGIDLNVGHLILGCNASFGLLKLCDAGFMGDPVANLITTMFTGAPKNVTLEACIGYQF